VIVVGGATKSQKDGVEGNRGSLKVGAEAFMLFLRGAQLNLRSSVFTVLDFDEVDITLRNAEIFGSVPSGVGCSAGGSWGYCCWSAPISLSCLHHLHYFCYHLYRPSQTKGLFTPSHGLHWLILNKRVTIWRGLTGPIIWKTPVCPHTSLTLSLITYQTYMCDEDKYVLNDGAEPPVPDIPLFLWEV